MKKILIALLLISASATLKAQCYTATYGLYPTATFTPACGATCSFSNITTLGYGGEYSNVNVITGNTYTFKSSVANDFITISNATGTASYIFGVGGATGLTWTATFTGVVRFYTHTNATCGNSTTSRTRSVCCVSPTAPNPCNSITTITCGTTNSVTFTAGNGSYNPPATSCGFNTPGTEKIFSFTPTTTGNYTISQPTSFGYIDYFYKPLSAGCGANGWTCIDDISNTNTGNANINIALTAGTAYYFLLDPESTTGGNVTFTLNCPVAAPANDNCSNATLITAPFLSSVISTVGSTTDVPTSTSLCDVQTYNIWFKVNGNNNTLRASTCNAGTNYDTEIRVYTGTCGSLNAMTEVMCNDDDAVCATSSLYSTVEWCSVIGTTYFISIGNWTTTAAFGNIQLRLESLTACSTLPVELTIFDGYSYHSEIKLFWETASETNSDYFEILRSSDMRSWETLGIQPAAGNSNSILHYEMVDFHPSENENYYKLIQYDRNGESTTYPVIQISMETNTSNCDYEYFSLTGQKVDIQECPSGIYLRKCHDQVDKIFRSSD